MSALPEQVELEVGLDEADDMAALRTRVAKKVGIPASDLPDIALLKRSLDCRKGRVRFHLVVLLGKAEQGELALPHPQIVPEPARAIVVGDGPAGLFCAYQLARDGIKSLVVDRGKPVQPRRRDLKGLNRRSTVDPDSNYCFGEGGAGTYSDGKLYTRSHKRGDVRDVIEILALHGAPEAILVEARPHIGSNRLPKVISAMRQRLEEAGVEFRFQSRVTGISRSGNQVTGVLLASGEHLAAEHVVLATGHSARDVFMMLHEDGLELEPKGFALGVRIEHPQPLINRIQYGSLAGHPKLPAAAYQLADSRGQSRDPALLATGVAGHAVFSFCMCPGGFIVPASTAPGELVVNGMSLSRRDSPFANSGLVVSLTPADLAKAGFQGALAGIEFQASIERQAFLAGGSSLKAPATRVTDFLSGRASSSVPKSSYIPGLEASNVAEVLDSAKLDLSNTLRDSLRYFDRKMRGYITEEAVLVGIESRTSSPVRIPRTDALVSPQWNGLYPAGEGAGYAGGIVSAAVDGMRVARAIAARIHR